MIGQSLAHYRILAKLGAGGMGEVYAAEDNRLGRRVAIKVLPGAMAAKVAALDRFKREARALAALNHPNIVTIYSVEEADSTHFLTMELVEGRPLGDMIPKGGFEVEKLFALGISLADALAAAHAQGIGHRDLKPSNVMLNDQGHVKVIDFGLAKLFQPGPDAVDADAPTVHQTMEGQILGTPAYMSPEQIEGRNVDHRTDIFSLGILLYEMATAQRPFKGENSISVMSSILRDTPTPLTELKPSLPEHLSRVVRRCLQKEPGERYQSALEIRNELKGLEVESRMAQRAAFNVPVESAPLVAPTIRATNLPVQLTSFVGRERETVEVTRLLAGESPSQAFGTRLLTLTGPGGTGKTRLALQIAAGLVERFPEGVWLVELAALSDPSLVSQSVASAMGLINTAGQPPLELLTRFLAPKRALLLLDNCEHLVAAAAELANELLRVCPRLQILATSREGLRLAGETTWPVSSLSVPSLAGEQLGIGALAALRKYESIRLFIERAKAVTPAFELTEQNAVAVAQLCQRLDGIPLAIELAAARTRLLPVEQLLDRIQDRFRLLTGGSRTALPRQQTLRALVDWSYDLLSEQERVLFERLSVFAGGWTMEAAEAVCADDGGGRTTGERGPEPFLRSEDILDLLSHLVEKSMVVADRVADGTARYRLLETLRQYGQVRLCTDGEAAADELRARHATFFAAMAEEAAFGMHGPDQSKWSDRLELDHDNVRAGLDWGKAAEAQPERVELALRLAAPLYFTWMRRGHGREARQHFGTLLSHPGAQRPTPARARALFGAGALALWQDEDNTTAWTLLNESLALAERLGDTRIVLKAHQNLGQLLYNRGDNADARLHQEEALRLARAYGDAPDIRISLENLADLAAEQGDAHEASELYEEALLQARRTGDQHGIASVLQSMGKLARATGKAERARELIGEGLNIMQRIGCLHCSARYLGDLALLAGESGERERAVRLCGAANALQERTGIVTPAARAETIAQSLNEARRHLGENAYAAAWGEGRALSLAEATAYGVGSVAASGCSST